jgi:CHAT domain-containing protein
MFSRVSCLIVAVALGIPTLAMAQAPSLQAPPRTITDIRDVLEQEKPDPARQKKLAERADAPVPAGLSGRDLARFHAERGEARGRLGRVRDAIADVEAAIDIAKREHMKAALPQYLNQLALLYTWGGDPPRSLAASEEALHALPESDKRGVRFLATRLVAINRIQLGDIAGAEDLTHSNEALYRELAQDKAWAESFAGHQARAHVAFGNAILAQAQGHFDIAARDYLAAEHDYRATLRLLPDDAGVVTRASLSQGSEWMVARAARAMGRAGRLADAEAEVRRAVANWLRQGGKYNLNTARILSVFTEILIDQGRYKEAEPLARTVVQIYDTLGAEKDSFAYAGAVMRIAGILALSGEWQKAAEAYDRLDTLVASWSEARKADEVFDATRIFTLYSVGRLADGIAMARALAERRRAVLGEDHPEAALARGMLGIGLLRSGHRDEAGRAFQSAAPILLAGLHDNQDDDDSISATTRAQRVQGVIESYIGMLAGGDAEAAAQAFRLAESIRGRSVQKALTESAARSAAGNPALAELARKEQDLAKQAAAELGLLTNALAQPPERRDAQAIDRLRARVESLRSERTATRTEIGRRFADYAALTDPQPPTLVDVQATLQPQEAFVSIYLGHDKSFVWAVRRDAPPAFAAVDLGADEIGAMVAELRKALEPNASSLDEIPPFDVALAHRLYARLLQPIEPAWKPARTLVVAANGPLGLLPLGLLPVAPATLEPAEPMFAAYRAVPWLARSHAVAMVPSAAALLTLRRLPPASASRERLIGFGDPLFNAEQAAGADPVAQAHGDARVATRGARSLVRRSAPRLEGMAHATLASLPRLPDTAGELRSVAAALAVDPAKALHLGKEANEQAIRTTDLSRYRIVMFATHGLVPGELDGLQQPALALSAPDVAGGDGNGLLTMDKILALKLDADWVVLSACNTGTGAGAGAEAASGLGRAFFYAGTRAVLVTNWSVHSQSARDLVTDLFRRQAGDPHLSRAEALRQAMVALMDGKGFTDDDGKTVFTYAHPLFWAPYSIIGDPG